jgi:hypothetical protein
MNRATLLLFAAFCTLAISTHAGAQETAPEAAESPAPADPGPPTESMAESANPGQVNGLPSTAQFIVEQKSGEWLGSNMTGKNVENAAGDTVGVVKDLVIDSERRVVGVVIGVGGFLGIGEKDVAIRFDDVRLERSEEGEVKVLANLSKDTLTAAPGYKRHEEQSVVREDK